MASPLAAQSPPFRAREANESPANGNPPNVFQPSAKDAPLRDPNVLPATFQEKALPLAPAGKNKTHEHSGTFSGIASVIGSLGIVLGLFFLVTWLFRRGMPKGAAQLPSDVIEVLGRAPLAGRQNMHLIRLGSKLILVSATPGGMDTLAEVTDPLEVDRLLGLCKQAQPNSVTGTFKQLLYQFSGEKPATSKKSRSVEPPADGRLFDAEVADA